MNLEIEKNIHISKITDALIAVCAEYQVGDGKITGNFKKSNAYFVFSLDDGEADIEAEGAVGGWKVGARAAFHCPIGSLAESWGEIKEYMFALKKFCKNRFVISFQYEKIYAVREGDEIYFLAEVVS
ncbi:hypothetical protein [Xanthomonas graminis]|uniref:hypothetical protein n=1 Tax=Xanthomonas graminis TaxID=3390026 RepID=UPI000A869494|nr:hypothetical protein [Xanthomonas translucens]UKE61958.1 hypothetical protein KM539_20175 [Xanthomonas translucens pv. poae]